ncbi:MAG: hypothetical protein NTY60_03525 [Proteobacteria bacterium]|nr:hypothetical protein [Pseudomonadota bacterium]
MNEKIIFVRTDSGEDEARSRTAHLSKDIKRALLMVDGTASVAEIMKRSSPSLRGMLEDMFNELARGGFIQDKSKVAGVARLILPASPKKSADEVDELDFTAAFRIPTQAMMDEEAAKVAEKARIRAEALSLVERLASDEEARVKAERDAAESRLRAIHAKAEQEAAEAKARAVAAEKARLVAEAASLAQARAAEQARLEAERQARELAERIRAESVAAREQAERHAREAAEQQAAEEKARLEAEAVRLQAEARVRAEEQARMEAERQARELAERIRAEKAAAEALARAQAERHAREVAEQQAAEEKARLEAETARLQAEARARFEEQARLEAARQARELAERIRAESVAAREQAERHAREAAEQQAAEEQDRLEAEAARLQAEARARSEEQARLEAERQARELRAESVAAALEAERIEAARHAREVLEATRRAEQHVVQAKAEAAAEARARAAAEEKGKLENELAKLMAQVEAEAQAHLEAEAFAKAEQEACAAEKDKQDARAVLEQGREAEKNSMLAAVIRLNEKHAAMEKSVFAALDELAQQEAMDSAEITDKIEPGVSHADSAAPLVSLAEKRTTIAAVVFFEVVDYVTQSGNMQIELKRQLSQLVAGSLDPFGTADRIVSDMTEGVAIGFLQHPTDALETAMHCRSKLMANKHCDYPDLRVRIGIHLGPISLVKDMNGQISMLGDGINSAQRVMRFAGRDQLYVSRAYFDFVSSLSDEYDGLFRYRGAQQDKQGRELQVYELLDSDAPAEESAQSDKAYAFNFDTFDAVVSIAAEQPQHDPHPDAAGQLLIDAAGLRLMDVVEFAAPPESPVSQAASVVEAPKYSEDESRHVADAQVKKWAEAAPQQAVPAEKKSVQQKVVQPKPAQPKVVQRAQPRKPVSWGKLAAGLVVLLAVVLFVVPFVLPTQGYVTSIEQQLGAKLQQPVHIGHLEVRILPAPGMVLSDIYIGQTKQIQVQQAQVHFSFAALFGSVKPIDSLDLDEVKVQGQALPQVSGWLQQVAGDHQYPVAHIALTHGQLEADGVRFSDVAGAIEFDSQGRFSLTHLNADGHKLALEIRAAPESKLQLNLTLRDSALPSLPNWVFEELKATGELSRDELRITELDGRIRGGALSGDARINWRAGWRVQGSLAAKAVPLQNINKLLAGDLNGSARFQTQAGSLSKLADAAILNGAFSVSKGTVNGVDIVETARLRSRESLPGGRTHFDELSSDLSYTNGRYRFSQLRINDHVVKAAGSLTIEQQELSGVISADLAMRAGQIALQVGGTTESPTLHVAR